jgi:hypothetical protein
VLNVEKEIASLRITPGSGIEVVPAPGSKAGVCDSALHTTPTSRESSWLLYFNPQGLDVVFEHVPAEMA